MTAALYPEEQRLLDVLNIQPTEVTRKSARMFDVSFSYVKAYHAFRAEPMRINARAWLVLLVISLAHDHCTEEVCHMMWGRTLPDYAGDWSFIRDAQEDELWMLFEQVGNKFFATPELAARFAQP